LRSGPLVSRLGAGVTLAELDADPHPVLARLRAQEPVAFLPALGAWLVTSREHALAAMRDDATLTVDDPRFSTARVVGASMLSTDGDAHARHRRPFAAPFRLASVRERFAAAVRDEAERLLAAIRNDGAADLRTTFTGPLAAAVMTDVLGLPAASRPEILALYTTIVDGVSRITAGEPVPAAAGDAFARLRIVVADALEHGPPASVLRTVAGDPAGLDREEIVANAAILLFGGIETTDGMIANLLLHVLSTPGAAGAVAADDALLRGAVEESLRLEPAAAVVDRYATRDFDLGGAAIAAGDLVTVSIAGANRDPAFFADPDRFLPERPNARTHLAFAQGPHVCLGMHLARLEADEALRLALLRLPGLRLDEAHPASPRGLVFRKPPALRVRYDAA
jgi:cytochrome P450